MKKDKLTGKEKREQKKIRAEHKKEIRKLIRQQIRAGRSNEKVLGIHAFDREGMFQMTDGRWICFYRAFRPAQLKETELLDLMKSLPAVTELYVYFELGRISRRRNCLSFTVTASDIAQAKRKQEAVCSMAEEMLSLKRICGYEVLSLLTGKEEDQLRNEIRMHKNLWKEYSTGRNLYQEHMEKGKKYISTFRVLQFPTGDARHLIEELSKTGKEVHFCLRIVPATSQSEEDFLRILEKKYNHRLDQPVCSNTSVSLLID